MKLSFTKMQGLGNDFVVLDATRNPIDLTPSQIRHIADRHFGVGCDQLLLVEPATQENVDFRYRIFNADGGEVEQCGNGARCFVRFVVSKGLTHQHDICVETASGIISLHLQEDGQVRVNMGVPKFAPAQIPLNIDAQASTYTTTLKDGEVRFSAVSMGNPHAVLLTPDVEHANVAIIGPQLESHPLFPQRVNVGFMQIINPHEIALRVYERGSGETLACGTGACAAAVTGMHQAMLSSPVKVNTRGGTLSISWEGENTPVWMTGPADIVFEGEIEI